MTTSGSEPLLSLRPSLKSKRPQKRHPLHPPRAPTVRPPP